MKEKYQAKLVKAWNVYLNQVYAIVEEAREEVKPILDQHGLELISCNGAFAIVSRNIPGLQVSPYTRTWRQGRNFKAFVDDTALNDMLDVLTIDVSGMNSDLGSLMDDWPDEKGEGNER